MNKGNLKITPGRLIVYLLSYGLAVLWVVPLLWMFITSVKPEGSPVTILTELVKPPFTLANYKHVLANSLMLRWSLNSAFIAITVTLVILLITSLAAYAISQIKFKGKKLVFAIIASGLMVPTEATIIPLFLIMIEKNLVNSYSSLILPSLAAPLGVMILKQYYDGIPKELVEAAKIDGAGLFRIWISIFLPLSRSSMAALSIFTFIGSWNNFLWPYLSVTSKEIMTLPIGIPLFRSSFGIEFTIPMAANVLATLPALIIFIIFQKNIIKGISVTGIKG